LNGAVHAMSHSLHVGIGQNPALLIGNRTGAHIGIDGNEIGAFNNNTAADLYLNGPGSTSNTILNAAGTGKVGIGRYKLKREWTSFLF